MSTADRAEWHAVVAPYIGASVWRSLLQLFITLALVAASLTASYWASSRSLLLTAALIPLTAGFIMRSFMIMHDCGHGSFLPSMRWNNVVGVITGLFTLVPYDQWRRDHAIHHASSGDLDRRGHGDITTITVREYLALTPFRRWQYRMYRHPLVLLFGGPFFLLFTLRFRAKGKGTHRRQVWSLWLTNVAIVGLLATVVLAWGWRALAVYGIAYYLAMSAGVWLFYVQHQFEDAYWEAHPEWDYETSAMRGSSHLKLPPPLRWLTASIGVHHIHHLAPKIPNYRLQKCYDENPRLQSAPIMTIGAGLAALRLALWDEDRRLLVRFADVRNRG